MSGLTDSVCCERFMERGFATLREGFCSSAGICPQHIVAEQDFREGLGPVPKALKSSGMGQNRSLAGHR